MTIKTNFILGLNLIKMLQDLYKTKIFKSATHTHKKKIIHLEIFMQFLLIENNLNKMLEKCYNLLIIMEPLVSDRNAYIYFQSINSTG